MNLSETEEADLLYEEVVGYPMVWLLLVMNAVIDLCIPRFTLHRVLWCGRYFSIGGICDFCVSRELSSHSVQNPSSDCLHRCLCTDIVTWVSSIMRLSVATVV